MLRRVLSSSVADAEMDEKAADEIRAGKATSVPLEHAMAGGVVTPRFPVDEGVKYKNRSASMISRRRWSMPQLPPASRFIMTL